MPNPLTLKQRLATLSVPSSPNPHLAPYDADSRNTRSPVAPRLRALFNGKKPSTNGAGGYDTQSISSDSSGRSVDKLDEVMSKLIFQAGVDYETRPMVVISASALPDPREVSYDQLLIRILAYLNLYVESDYTVVFFAAGGTHTPGWNWVWKAYRSLSRKYRKNLKRLFVVHSNFFTKMLFSLAGAIISPKFFRKIAYINSLSDLAYHVPLTQIDIPPAVYRENLKYEREIRLPTPSRADLFGVPLEDLMGFDGEKGGLPRVVKDCIQFLRETGLQEDGLFRRSPNSVILRQVQQAYDRGHVVSLDSFADPHLAAVLLKKYLRDLPEPIFSESLYSTIRRCPTPTADPDDMTSVLYIRDTLLPELPHCAYILLSHILHLLHEVSLRSATNRMDAHNLAVVICPNLVKGSNPVRDVTICVVPGGPSLSSALPPTASPHPAAMATSESNLEGKTTLGAVIKLCIQRYYEIFDEVVDRMEALPVRSVSLATPQPQTQLRHPTNSRDGATPNGDPVEADIVEARAGGDMYAYRTSNRDSMFEDEEEIDDEMLVMPLGPNIPGSRSSGTPVNIAVNSSGSVTVPINRATGGGPPSAWNGGHKSSSSRDLRPNVARSVHNIGLGGSSSPIRPNGIGGAWYATHSPSSPSLVPPSPSLSTSSSSSSTSQQPDSHSQQPPKHQYPYVPYTPPSQSRARSMISIEKGYNANGTFKKGSISIGRSGMSTVRRSSKEKGKSRDDSNGKGSGSGVEAMGITAAGFFSPPGGGGERTEEEVPPLPPLMAAFRK